MTALIVISIVIYYYFAAKNDSNIEESARLISIGSIIAFIALILDVWESYRTKKCAIKAISIAEECKEAIEKDILS